jgi:O-antigen ligase
MLRFPGRNTSGSKIQPALRLKLRNQRAILIGGAIAMTLMASVPLGMIDLASAQIVVGVILAVYLGTVLIMSHQDALIAAICAGMGVFIDWYHLFTLPPGLQVPVAALPALALVSCRLLTWVSARPSISLPHVWLWGLLMILAAPAILLGINFSESLAYYGNIIVVPLLMYLLGMVVGLNMDQVRRLLRLLAGFGTLIAVHTLIEAYLGIFLLKTPFVREYLATNSNFPLSSGSHVSRAGSFLLNPDSNGTFLAVMATLPVGLFLESSSRVAKVLYGVEIALIMLALLDTYSVGAIAALAGGLLIFIWLVGSNRARFRMLAFLCTTAVVFLVAFPSQIGLLLQHGSAKGELSQRIGIWQTAIRIIQANPLTGIGLGQSTYMMQSDLYRVPLQQGTAPTPHNSYLELAALAGIPVLVVFLVILASTLWRTLYVLFWAERMYRPLLASVIAAAITLSCNSFEGIGWTLRPVAWMMWILLGAISSPFLIQAPSALKQTLREGRAMQASVATP